jgi:SAM-dependent methyltransferase
MSSSEPPPPHPRAASRDKLALSHVGGETWVAGDPSLCELLVHALDVSSVDKDRLTHGFHSYAARMHWATPARLIQELELAGKRVLDPFCGSGTTLIEAKVAGCEAFGVDLSPLAVRLSRVKTDTLNVEQRQELLFCANALRIESEELVQARANIRAELPKGEIGWYEPHVLKEMAGLYSRIEALEQPPELCEALRFVFSSLVVKFSRQRSDTSNELVERRVRKGLVSEFFERKAYELAERLEALDQASAEANGTKPNIIEGDARALIDYTRTKFDCIITSPPYGGTYDYVEHHARRLAWLGIKTKRLEAHELGARRRGDDPQRFTRELHSTLQAMRGVLRKEGMAILQMGDGEHGSERVPADELIASLAPDVGFYPLAVASQGRPDFRGGRGRAEHLMVLLAR